MVGKIKNQKIGSSANLANSSNQQGKFKSSTKFYDNLLRNLKSKMAPAQLEANDIPTSNGTSIWLSSLLLKHERFSLTKRAFFDAVSLIYGCELKRLPHECVCKAKYSIDHALTWKTGGFVILQHNEMVNVTADMLSIVSKGARKETTLSTTPDSSDEFQADISVRSF